MPLGCDSNIPLIAQELMKKMIHQFAMEYASKCLLHTSTNGVTTRTSSPLLETSDAPLDLTVSRTQEEKEREPEPGRENGWESLEISQFHLDLFASLFDLELILYSKPVLNSINRKLGTSFRLTLPVLVH